MVDLPIVIGLSPNLFYHDVLFACKILFKPWIWKRGENISKVEVWAKNYFKIDTAVTFNSARSALFISLQALNLHEGDEVMLQSFTCVAVPNAVKWANLKPVYVDIDDTSNFNIDDAYLKLTPKTKVLIIQHTFGVSANLDKIVNFCKKHNLILIEDCAHSLGATYHGQKLGTFGSVGIFSFGRDKIISSVFGGMAITNNKQLGTKITQLHHKLQYSGILWILQQLLHPIITWTCLKLYNVLNIGKLILFISQKLHFLSKPVYEMEKKLQQPQIFPQKYPNALAYLVISQLNQLSMMNKTRQQFAKYYDKNLDRNKYQLSQFNSEAVYLRYNVLTENANLIRNNLKLQGIVLGNWYHNIIDPQGINLDKIGYKLGSCPKSEVVAKTSLNLPTSPTLSIVQIQKLVKLLNSIE